MPVEDGTFDYAVGIHVLQDLPYVDVVPALREVRRVLKPGGVLRRGLPDLGRAARAYVDGDRRYFYIDDGEVRSLGGKVRGERPEIAALDNRERESLFVEATR